MKTSIYIENKRTQIILTPENKFEKEIISKINENQVNFSHYTGSFSDCVGGYVRQFKDEKSLMLVLKEDKEEGI